MIDSNDINNSIAEKRSFLNLFSILMIVVVMFQPLYSIVIETLDYPQDISLNDQELTDSEEDDNQEEENNEKFIEVELLETSNSFIVNKNSIRLQTNLDHWKEHILGITTPPPETV